MNDARKVMSITYKHFSCTLEGFDDPFTTMRSVVDYFKSIADEDFAAPNAPENIQNLRDLQRNLVSQTDVQIETELGSDGIIVRQGTSRPAFDANWQPQPLAEPEKSDEGRNKSFNNIQEKLLSARKRGTQDKDADPAEAKTSRIHQPMAPARPSRSRDSGFDIAERDVNRLIRTASHHMKEPEKKRRREAYGYIRASATQQVELERAEKEVAEQRLNNLTPLLLMPEQRVEPVAKRPKPCLYLKRHPQSLLQLIDTLGATEIEDLLETTAAYLTVVKNHIHFTFGDLIAELEHNSFDIPRDALMQSFGSLVYDARIEKADQTTNLFTISPGSIILAQTKQIVVV